MTQISEKSYWDAIHIQHSHKYDDWDDGYKNHCNHEILKKICAYYKGGSLLEIGAGSSDWMIHLSKKLNPSVCTGLDYSEEGCLILRKKAEHSNTNINVVLSDFFNPPDQLKNSFDFVVSFGVVEHFLDLAGTLKAISAYVKPNGIIYTLIPNLSGINGLLVKILNRKIYDIHVPHDLKSFESGHNKAGLEILWSGYLCSNNFAVLSSCFEKETGFLYWIYKQLTRLSKVVWYFESRFFNLPTSKTLSPYIIVVSRLAK